MRYVDSDHEQAVRILRTKNRMQKTLLEGTKKDPDRYPLRWQGVDDRGGSFEAIAVSGMIVERILKASNLSSIELGIQSVSPDGEVQDPQVIYINKMADFREGYWDVHLQMNYQTMSWGAWSYPVIKIRPHYGPGGVATMAALTTVINRAPYW
jgi:hypothetical protein